jgi:hypothetical protein
LEALAASVWTARAIAIYRATLGKKHADTLACVAAHAELRAAAPRRAARR